MYFNLGLFAVGAAFLLAFNGSYKRFEHEKLKNYETVNK
jgi:hypothetical protein